jgi:hypothetical protein
VEGDLNRVIMKKFQLVYWYSFDQMLRGKFGAGEQNGTDWIRIRSTIHAI